MNNYYVEHYTPDEILEYLRKSRSDDPLMSVEEVLEKHETMLNDYAERNFGSKLPEKNIFREVASSETIDSRPEMLKLLEQIESPKFKAILVVEVQRLSRGDLEDAGRLIKLLRYTNTKVITPQKTYDLKDEYDRDAFERELKRGNEYLEYFKKIQARGRLLSVQEGNYIGSIPPYGYDKIFITVGKKKCPTLVENKEQADVVRMIFDMYVNTNMGYKRICDRLDELNIKPPKGDYWSPPAIKDMIANVHYIGKVKWNWRKTVTVVEHQEIVKTRPKSKNGDFLVYDGKHEGIIPEPLFDAAQLKQGRNHRTKSTVKMRNPLASLLFCNCCGHALSMRRYYKPDGTERCAPRYLCDVSHCKTSSVEYSEVIDRVCDILEKYIADFEILLKNNQAEDLELHKSFIANLENKMKELEAKELSQWEAQADPDPANRMPAHIFQKLNAKLLQEKEEVKQALNQAYESIPLPVKYEDKILQFSDALRALKNPNIEAEAKNKYLKLVIERIEFYKEKPVRITKTNCETYGINKNQLKTGAHWYAPAFDLDVKLRI